MERAAAGSSAQEEAALARPQRSQSSWKQQSVRRRRSACPDATYAYRPPFFVLRKGIPCIPSFQGNVIHILMTPGAKSLSLWEREPRSGGRGLTECILIDPHP